MSKYTYILVLFLFGLFACGDDGDCLREDYLGQWSGVVNCEGEDAETTSIVIRAGSAPNEILLDDGESEYSVMINGCKIDIEKQTLNLLGFEVEISGDGELDGNSLIVRQRTVFIGITQECEVELSK